MKIIGKGVLWPRDGIVPHDTHSYMVISGRMRFEDLVYSRREDMANLHISVVHVSSSAEMAYKIEKSLRMVSIPLKDPVRC